MEILENSKFFAININGDVIYPFSDGSNLFLILTATNNGISELSTVNTFGNNSTVSSTNYSAKVNIIVNINTTLTYINIGSGGGGGSGGFIYNSNPTDPQFGFFGSGGGGGSGGCVDNNTVSINLDPLTEYIGYYLLNLGTGAPQVSNTITIDGNNGKFNTNNINNQFILLNNNNIITNLNVCCGVGGIGGNSNGNGVSNIFNIDNTSYGGGSSSGSSFSDPNMTFYNGFNTANVIGSPNLSILVPSINTYYLGVCAGGSGGNSCCGFLSSSGENYNISIQNDSFLNNNDKANSPWTTPSYTILPQSSFSAFGSYGGGGFTIGSIGELTFPHPNISQGYDYYTAFTGFGGCGGFNNNNNEPPTPIDGKSPILNPTGSTNTLQIICNGCGGGGGGGSGQPVSNTGDSTNVGSNGGDGLPGILMLILPLSSIYFNT